MTKIQNNSAVGVAEDALTNGSSNEKFQQISAENTINTYSAVNVKMNTAPEEVAEFKTPAKDDTAPSIEQQLFETPSEEAVPVEEIIVVESPRKTKNKLARRTLSLTIMAIVALLTLFFAYRLFFAPKTLADSAPTENKTSGAAISLSPEQTRNIAVEVVQKRPVAGEVKSPGKVTFNSNQISPVLPQFAGRLIKLTAEVGNTVRAGQVLGTIETPDIVQPQADYQQALANKRTSETTLEHAAHTRERDERLAKVEAIPLRELQDAQTDEKHAKEDLGRSEQAINAAQSKLKGLHFSDAEVKSLEAGGKVLNREVPLVAPISGTIIDRKAGLGQVVQPGGDALFQIANLSNVWVNAEVYEDQLSKLRVGLPAIIETPAYPNERFAARVDQIGSTVDPDKRTVAVRCILPNTAGKLKPGLFVNVSLGGVSNLEAITVPATAIVTEGDKRAVFVETAPYRYEKREITVGDETEGAVVVKTGLKEGDRVVTKGGLLVAAEGV